MNYYAYTISLAASEGSRRPPAEGVMSRPAPPSGRLSSHTGQPHRPEPPLRALRQRPTGAGERRHNSQLLIESAASDAPVSSQTTSRSHSNTHAEAETGADLGPQRVLRSDPMSRGILAEPKGSADRHPLWLGKQDCSNSHTCHPRVAGTLVTIDSILNTQ